MFTIPAELAAALAGTGPAVVQVFAELWSGTPKVRTATAEVSAGTVTDDTTGAVRRSCSVTFPDLGALLTETVITGTDRRYGDGQFGSGVFGDYRRRALRGLLLPLKTELRLFWQAKAPGATGWTVVPLGRFTAGEPAFTDAPGDQSVTVTGYDAASDIAASAWDAPFVVAAGTNAATALAAILTNRLPAATLSIPATTAVVPQLIFTPGASNTTAAGNPWDDAVAVARVAGWALWVDRAGVITAGVPANPATGTAVVDLRGTGTVQQFVQTQSAGAVVNTVLVYGETSGASPVFAVVRDLDGPYGVNTIGRVLAREYRSATLLTVTDATNAGIARLRAWSALTETVAMVTFPVPHLDAGDLATVTSSGLELDDPAYRVERIVHSLDPASPAAQITVSRRVS